LYEDKLPPRSPGLIDRRAVLSGMAAVALFPSARAAEPPADVPGWGATRWGMSRDEIARVVGTGLVRLTEPLRYDKLIVRETLPNQRLAGRPFVALFQLDPASERLAQVLLRYRGDFPMLSDFTAVRDLLAKDYGKPHERRAETDHSGSFPWFWIEATWRFPTTVVVLSLTDPKAEAFSRRRKIFTLRYAPARASG
jgi:hypothetical protein